MWLSAIKLAVSAGSKIYANKQRTKMAMSDAQLMHASRMAEGKEAYQGKLLEARQSDWKGRGSFDNSLGAHSNFGLGSCKRRSISYGQSERVLRTLRGTPELVYKFVDPCRCEHLWYKGNTNI